MTSREFCYWLQGMFEIANLKQLDETQTSLIKRHLALVFKHEIDPSYPNQQELNEIHNPSPSTAQVPQIGGTDAHGNILRC